MLTLISKTQLSLAVTPANSTEIMRHQEHKQGLRIEKLIYENTLFAMMYIG